MEELTTTTTKKLTNVNLRNYTTKLKNCGANIRKNYIKIAFLLTEIDNTECYLDDGFEDVCDYASKVLNIQKTTTYNLLKIGKEYISENGERTVLTEKGEDYGVSQLQALLPVGVDKAKELHDDGTINPTMSVRQIKGIVKNITSDDNEDEDKEENSLEGSDVVDTNEDGEVVGWCATIDIYDSCDVTIMGQVSQDFKNELLSLVKKYKDEFEAKES